MSAFGQLLVVRMDPKSDGYPIISTMHIEGRANKLQIESICGKSWGIWVPHPLVIGATHKWLAMRIRIVPRPPWQHLAIEHSNCLNWKTSSNSYEGLIFHYQVRFLWENTTRQVLLLFRIRACSGHLPRVFSDSLPGAGRNISQTGPKGPPDFLQSERCPEEKTTDPRKGGRSELEAASCGVIEICHGIL